MNQGKLKVVKQVTARVNMNVLGISELNGLEPIIQSEESQKEKHQYSIPMHIYGI